VIRSRSDQALRAQITPVDALSFEVRAGRRDRLPRPEGRQVNTLAPDRGPGTRTDRGTPVRGDRARALQPTCGWLDVRGKQALSGLAQVFPAVPPVKPMRLFCRPPPPPTSRTARYRGSPLSLPLPPLRRAPPGHPAGPTLSLPVLYFFFLLLCATSRLVRAPTHLTNSAAGRKAGSSPRQGAAAGHRRRAAGRPGRVLFDEAVNGLDPEGIRGVRNLDENRWPRGPDRVRLQSPDREMALTADRCIVNRAGGCSPNPVAELSARSASLEDAFMDD